MCCCPINWLPASPRTTLSSWLPSAPFIRFLPFPPIRLGFSFWLLINATGTQLLPCILLFWAMIGSDKSGRMEEEAEGTKEETVFMY